MNIRQPEIATGMAISEFFVIEAQHRQHRGVQVVHMHPVFLRPKSKLIRRPVDRGDRRTGGEVRKYRCDLSEPMYDESGTIRADFFTA